MCTFTKGSPLPTALTVFEGAFLVLTFAANMVVNVLFTVTVVTQRALHQRDLVLNMFLAVLHIVYGFVANATHLTSLITGVWVFGKPACYIEGNAVFFISLMRYVLVLAITVERFGVVMYPFKYPLQGTKVITTVILIGSLLCLMISALFDIDARFGCYNFDPSFHDCFIQMNCKTPGCYFCIMAAITIITLFGVIVPFIMYAVLCRQANKFRRSSVTCGSLEPAATNARATSSAPVSQQAVVTGLLLLVSVVVLSTPLQLYFAARTILHIDTSLEKVSVIAVLLGNLYYLIPIADGLVAMQNRDFKSRLATVCSRRFSVRNKNSFRA